MWLQIAILLSTALCAAISVAWWFTEPVLRFGGFDAAQARLAGTFARYSILGLWPNVMYTLVRLFLLAQQDVIPSVVVAVVCAVGNVGLNQLFIHGAFGWGGLGFIGSPIATATTRVLLLVMLGSYAFCLKRYEHPTWSGWSRGCLVKSRWHSFVVTQALPQMISAALEEWQLQVIAFLAARLGEVQIATHNSVINLFYVLTSMMYGMISATKYGIMGCRRGYTSVSSPRVCVQHSNRVPPWWWARTRRETSGGHCRCCMQFLRRRRGHGVHLWPRLHRTSVLQRPRCVGNGEAYFIARRCRLVRATVGVFAAPSVCNMCLAVRVCACVCCPVRRWQSSTCPWPH